MSGETETAISAWTVDSLHQHFIRIGEEKDRRYAQLAVETDVRYEQRFVAQEKAVLTALVAQEKAVNAALIAAERAVLKAEAAAERRFESVNEFRATLQDQAATFVSRAEVDVKVESIIERVTANGTRIDRMEASKTGKYELLPVAASVLAAISLIVSIVAAISLIATR